ncbi:MAG: hypothetical protein HC880_04960 [Bacteroidia bacterium]|nr:hypothetical protein [Bacteroidia bacterium]
MRLIIKGSLKAHLCENCFENLSDVNIRLYRPLADKDVVAVATAATKDTFRMLSEEEVQQKENQLIAETTTDAQGNFYLEIAKEYQNQAFEIDFRCSSVPRKGFTPKKGMERQFHLTTLYPQWREDQQGNLFYTWEYTLAAQWWCIIRGQYFDAWIICGRLLNCQTGQPLPNIKIIAKDADLISDDLLGSDFTDSSGYFRIDYTSSDFKRTFLSPIINVETDPAPPYFSSGPDVYFQLEYAGIPIQFETAANRRSNVGYCLCVSLCVDEFVPEDRPIPASLRILANSAGITS